MARTIRRTKSDDNRTTYYPSKAERRTGERRERQATRRDLEKAYR